MHSLQTPLTPTAQGLPAESSRSATSASVFLPREQIAACASFRDAVCLAWDQRAIRGMTQRTLAETLEVPASHLSNMLNRDPVDRHGKARQDLPAKLIADFERVIGNRAVSQYLARMAMLTLMEEVITAQRGL
ncbi:XRE family transcriptional regulator [Paraburkholderia tropica]|uniref:XRE family transcriptional regulator n=1 Tax=Paraburkholderia tropica TaxID=92647 RepID=UPI000A59B6A5|nr:XRE family transcriptional regulator [Paraburkholderia tropica]